MAVCRCGPTPKACPPVSTLNARDGFVTSNLAIVPTLNGDVDAYGSRLGDLVQDMFIGDKPVVSTVSPRLFFLLMPSSDAELVMFQH